VLYRERVKNIGIILLLTVCGFSSIQSVAQDSDLEKLVRDSEKKRSEKGYGPIEHNETALEAARKRVSDIASRNADFTALGDSLGYDITTEIDKAKRHTDEQLYVFVSFSMPEKLIKEYVRDAHIVGGAVLIGGLHNDNFADTVRKVEGYVESSSGEANGGIAIDPKAFETFGVKAVPTIILAENPLVGCLDSKCDREIPLHDRMSGSVSLGYALKQFSIDGDLSQVAKSKSKILNKTIYSNSQE